MHAMSAASIDSLGSEGVRPLLQKEYECRLRPRFEAVGCLSVGAALISVTPSSVSDGVKITSKRLLYLFFFILSPSGEIKKNPWRKNG